MASRAPRPLPRPGPPARPCPDARRAVAGPDHAPTAVLTGVSSDAHTWNLVYLQLLLEEAGWEVVNLGATTPDHEVVEACLRHLPDLLVVSSVNGHGAIDGARLITVLRGAGGPVRIPAVIGGKLGVVGGAGADQTTALLGAGFDAVFPDGADTVPFTGYLAGLSGERLAVTP